MNYILCLICTIFFDPIFNGIVRILKGKVLYGLLWIITIGLFGIGWIIDIVTMITKKKLTFLA